VQDTRTAGYQDFRELALRLRPRAFLPAPVGDAGTGAKARTGAPLEMT